MPAVTATPGSIPSSVIDEICTRFAEGKNVRLSLPEGAQLHIDRQLPFLCVYRGTPGRRDAGTSLFATAEASYLLVPDYAALAKDVQKLVRRLALTACAKLGGYLIVEIWSGDVRELPQRYDPESGELVLPPPGFRILTRQPHRPDGAAATLQFELQQIHLHKLKSEVTVDMRARNHPPGLTQLVSEREARGINCHVVGLEVRPVYRDPVSGEVYSDVLHVLRRGVTRGLKKCFFTFAMNRTNVRPLHYFALGRKALPQLVWNVDRQLADVSSQFKFLLLCTPINAERSRREFMDEGQTATPLFQYRPQETDPLQLKRRLWRIPTERIEDPVLAHVLRQTQDELDRQITMLADLGTERFLLGSLQIYGDVEAPLLKLAQEILRHLAERDDSGESRMLNAQQFARLATNEIERYRQAWPGFAARAMIVEDMYAGLLSTGGNLLIGRETRIPARRAEALIQHEIGTHLVTYYNGKTQPLRLLKVGLAGYDGLQEGLAVLSEYLVGGLNHNRLRTLAARVVAADQLVRGTCFSDVFHLLVDEHRFDARIAYTITLRVFRGGGLTKDVVYLRGLAEILRYVAEGGDLDPLMVGKIAADHVPIINELLLRGVLKHPPLKPRYIDDPAALERLDQLGSGCTVLDLLDR